MLGLFTAAGMSLPLARKYYVQTPTPVTISIPTAVYASRSHGFILRPPVPTQHPPGSLQPFTLPCLRLPPQIVQAPGPHWPQYVLRHLLTQSTYFAHLLSKTDLPSPAASSFTSPHHQPLNQKTLHCLCEALINKL